MGNVIPKNRKAYGYDYADLGSVVNYVTEVLGFRVEQDIHYNNLPQYPNGYGFVVTHYWQDFSKSWSEYAAPVPIIVGDSAGKREQPFMQRYGSAETYARRYSLLTLFCLATSDDDGQLAGYQRGTTQTGGRAPSSREHSGRTRVRSDQQSNQNARQLRAVDRLAGAIVHQQFQTNRIQGG